MLKLVIYRYIKDLHEAVTAYSEQNSEKRNACAISKICRMPHKIASSRAFRALPKRSEKLRLMPHMDTTVIVRSQKI